MFKLFKKNKSLTWLAPMTGEIKPLDQAADPAFAQKMMGDGFCIDPREGKIHSPVKGEIMFVFPSKHAIGIKAESGHEILIHIGVDTVELNGEGFSSNMQAGDRVEPGDLLIEMDIESVKGKVPSLITPVIITNLEGKTLTVSEYGPAQQGDKITLEIN